jgi:hypothetical protein
LAEHLTFNQGVGGSIPPRLTILLTYFRRAIGSRSQLCYHFATASVVKTINGRLIAHRKPPAVGVDRQLDAGVTKLALDVHRAFSLLEEQ